MQKYIAIWLVVLFLLPVEVGAIVRLPNPGVRRGIESRISRRGWEKRFQANRTKRVETIRRGQPQKSSVQPVVSKPVSAPGANWDVSTPTFLLLGSVSPIIGAARVFPTAEPLNVSALHVVLMDAVPSVQSFLVYDGQSRFLGNASLDPSIAGGATYVLPIRTSTLILPQREVFQFYVKARIRSYKDGGVSGENVQIRYLIVKGDGFWSNRSYSQSTSETFTIFETARAMINTVSRVSPESGVLVNSAGQLLGAFEFEGIVSDAGATIRITDLTFQVNQAGGISISNAKLKRLGSGTETNCTVGGSILTCAAILEQDGSIRSGPATFQVYGDVSVPSGLTSASLQLVLNAPGTSSSPGALGWTDGQSTFQWVQFEQPVAGGTVFSY